MSKILREFKLISGRIDNQYVSHINSKAQPTGYDKKEQYALDLTTWQIKRVSAYLNSLNVSFTIVE